jgi:metal-responsive CopG/Arc/MetJ family transcriptional regulator
MNTQKVAITMPIDLVKVVDEVSRKKGISRSKYISVVLRERILSERQNQIREAYDQVFSDASIQKEQLETAMWFDKAGGKEGQEW